MPIPPVTLNLLQLLPGDDQSIHTDKINFNFDQILSLGGGPPGLPGVIGIQGVPGSQGLQGFMGNQGTPGSHWYVQNTTPLLPAPNNGDYWFNTDTLDVFQWDGASWVSIGTLTIAGVFKEATGDIDRIILTNPSPLKSLVLSPIDYGVGAPPGGAYKLKLIGTSGSNIMNIGLLEGGLENPSGSQSYITASIITPSTTYGLGIINPAGPIEVNAPGTTLKIVEQAGGISEYELNGLSLKIQIDPTERNLGFSPVAGSGLGFHIGLQDAVTVPTSRGLSVIDHADGFKISLRGAHSNPVSGDSGNYSGVYFDSENPRLSDTAIGSRTLWSRNRSLISGSNQAFINTEVKRNFNDSGNGVNPWRSVTMSIQAGLDNSIWHGINFSGGAKDATEGTRQQLILTTPSSNTWSEVHNIAMDYDGNLLTGRKTFISDHNSTINPINRAKTNINIEATNSFGSATTGIDIFGGIHFVPTDAAGTSDGRMGLTAGLGTLAGLAISNTHAGILFNKEHGGTGMGINLSTGTNADWVSGGGIDGAHLRFRIESNGYINFYGRSNSTQFPERDYRIQMNLEPNQQGIGYIGAIDYKAHGGVGMKKDIIIQSEQSLFTDSEDPNFRGGGNLGVGRMTDFLGNKPQTKLHVFGAVTYGSREEIGAYEVDVAPTHWFNNWTFGFDHYSNGHNNLTLGGLGTRILDPVANVVVIGSISGKAQSVTSSTQDHMVIIPSYTFMTTEAGSSLVVPGKAGIYDFGYTGTKPTDTQYDFGPNTYSTDTTQRIGFARTRYNPGIQASNGLDITSYYDSTLAAPPGGAPGGFTPPTPQGYYIHCIHHQLGFTGRDESTIFLVDGFGKVSINAPAKYRPSGGTYIDATPSTWVPGNDGGISPSSKWTDNHRSVLQVNASNNSDGGSILLSGGSLAWDIPALTNFWNQIAYRTERNNYTTGFGASRSSRIETPIIARQDDAGHAGNPLIIEPGLVYSRPTGTYQNNHRTHGSPVYIKGGDAGINMSSFAAVRGGDVILHGGYAWDNDNKASTVPDLLNGNDFNTAGYGNVSLAYDWTRQQTAGGVSIGVGSSIQTMYTGTINILPNGAAPNGLQCRDLHGNNSSYTHMQYTAGEFVEFRINFPTPLPVGATYSCVSNAGGGGYARAMMSVIPILITSTWIQMYVFYTPKTMGNIFGVPNSGWNSGEVPIHFIVTATTAS